MRSFLPKAFLSSILTSSIETNMVSTRWRCNTGPSDDDDVEAESHININIGSIVVQPIDTPVEVSVGIPVIQVVDFCDVHIDMMAIFATCILAP